MTSKRRKTRAAKTAGTRVVPAATVVVATEKFLRTRAKLMDAALQVMARKGLEATTVSDIADAASVSRGTVYNYFQTTEGVMQALVAQMADEFNTAIDAANRDEPDAAKRLAFGVRHYFRYAAQHPRWSAFLVRFALSEESLRAAMQKHVVPDIQMGFASGRFKLRPEQLMATLALVGGAVVAALMGLNEKLLPADVGDDLCELILKALGVPADEARSIARLQLPELQPPPERLIRLR